ncbi:MAG: glycosyltransferase [Prevotella sp.]
MKKKVLVIGYFGHNTNQLDGQTVKTRDVYRLVGEQTNGDVDYYDTEDFQYKRLSIFTMFWKVIRCRTLFYLPAHNNLKYIFPFIFVLSAIFRVQIHYFVVGGWLREFLMPLPLHRVMLRRIEGIHVETKRLKNELEEYFHYENVDLFPNFRFFEFDPKRFESEKLRIVFMARVNKMKGLDWIFELAETIEEQHLQERFSITFYGPVHEGDKAYFEENVLRFSFVEYKGALEPKDIYEALSKYDVMLLPTHYYTEGLPGSVVDAYISGIPVIVTEWKHSHEFVKDGVSGFIVPFENGQKELFNKVMLLEKDRNLLHQLQANALQKRMEFAPPSAREKLKCYLKIPPVSR